MSRNISFQGELLRVCAIAFLASIIVGNQAAGRSAQSKSSPSSAQISNIQTIGIEQAYYLYRENAAVFVDTRESAAFEIGHVPGAVNTPDIASLSAKTVDQLKAAANIVVYGHRGMAGRPQLLAHLATIRDRPMQVFPGGLPLWNAMHLPVTTEKQKDLP